MNRKWFIALLIVIGGTLGTGVSLITAEVTHSTAGAEFCGSCHSMKPMAKTFELDVHGGQNEHGFVAQCVDCHLPQDSVFGYMVEKTKHGINDVFVENFTNTDNIDWIDRRHERERFVFDSGCLNCHQKLLDKEQAKNPKSLEAHAHYKAQMEQGDPLQCVSCHMTVGHNGMLRSELNKRHPEYTFE